MSGHRRVEVLREVLAAFNRHDLDAIMAHFAEECVFAAPSSREAAARPRAPSGLYDLLRARAASRTLALAGAAS